MKSWVKFANGQITEGPIGADAQPEGFVEYVQVLNITEQFAPVSVSLALVDGKCVKTVTSQPTYASQRMGAYPALSDQFDMLWHAMDADPSKRVEPFYTAIKAVKDAFPKPPGTT